MTIENLGVVQLRALRQVKRGLKDAGQSRSANDFKIDLVAREQRFGAGGPNEFWR